MDEETRTALLNRYYKEGEAPCDLDSFSSSNDSCSSNVQFTPQSSVTRVLHWVSFLGEKLDMLESVTTSCVPRLSGTSH